MCEKEWGNSEDQIAMAMTKTLDMVDTVFGIQHESE